jgi:hypothetical protein
MSDKADACESQVWHLNSFFLSRGVIASFYRRIPFWLCDSSVEPWAVCRGLQSTSILIFSSLMCCPGSACTLLLTCTSAFLFHALLSYGDKLLLLDDGSGRCSEFVGAAIDLVAELAVLVKTVSVLQRRRCCLKNTIARFLVML